MKTCLIEFIVSLLTCEDNSIVKRLLEVTGSTVLVMIYRDTLHAPYF